MRENRNNFKINIIFSQNNFSISIFLNGDDTVLGSLLGAGGLPLGLENRLHLLPLSLSSNVSSEALFRELQASLVLRHLEELKASFFVGSKAGDFSDHLAHELYVFVLDALPARRLHWRLVFGDTESLVPDASDRHRVLWSHFYFLSYGFPFSKIFNFKQIETTQ